MKKRARPILWTQGLFLQPQHFQQFDLYMQSLFYPYAKYTHPYQWGVIQGRISDDSLEHRLFEVMEIEMVFPDGTWVQFPGNAYMQPRSLQEIQLEPGQKFTVYLGLKKWQEGEQNVVTINKMSEADERDSRYVSMKNPEEVEDVHGAGPLARMRFMNYIIKVFWETEVEKAGDYLLIPVAQLEYIDGTMKKSRSFAPPAVSLAQSDLLLHTVKNIRDQISSRCAILEEYKNPEGAVLTENEPNYIIYLLALRSLNRYLPMLHQCTADPMVHPWDMYGQLRQLIGELSSFTDRFNALGVLKNGTRLLPDYDHSNLFHCYTEANVLIGELLNTLTIGAQNIVTLEREEDFFKGDIPLESLESRSIFYLVIKANGKEEEIVHSILHLSTISSSERISTLISRALPGVQMKQRPIPPPGLPRRPNSYYFKFEQDNDEWFELKRTGHIHFFWPDAPADTEVQLIILKT